MNLKNQRLISHLFNLQRSNYSKNVSSTVSSINQHKIDLFDSKVDSWWDPNGSMSHLHLIDPCRISTICSQLKTNPSLPLTANNDQPLSGLKIVDIGCGVGVISEKLASLGAEVTGLDAAQNLIKAAKRHATLNPAIAPKLEYLVSTPEEHATSFEGKYDVALALFVIGHSKNRSHFLDGCHQLLKPNGSLLILHGNRTFTNRIALCFWNPYILRLFPTNLFKFKELGRTSDIVERLISGGKWKLMDIRGMRYKFLGGGARLTNSLQYFNMIHFVKNSALDSHQ